MPNPETNQSRDVILDSINEGVFTVDLGWRITSFNRAAERITGVNRGRAEGRICSDVFHASICRDNCALSKTFQTGRPVLNTTAYIIDNHNNRVPVRISAAVLKDDGGRVIGGVETFQDLREIEELQKELQERYTFEDIVGRSPEMMKLFKVLPQIAESGSTVLLEGASGTGKELFARAIHNLSTRKHGRFVPVSCAALPDTLLESELFGHKAGAFTDARREKAGRFALADGGTLFLDEIGDISPALQVRLLRVLQERMIEPLGATEPRSVDVRVVSATNRNLADLVKEGLFREDLYYRIRVVHLMLPSLSSRREDIPLLIDHIVAKLNRRQGKNIAGVSAEALACLMEHDFPGNVRELENIIEQAFVLCRSGIIEARHLPPELRRVQAAPGDIHGPMDLKTMERRFIEQTLRYHRGNRLNAARDLGIDPSTLYRKIKALKIPVPGSDGRGRRQ